MGEIHKDAATEIFSGLERIGLVDKKTVREFKGVSQIITPEEIQLLREREHISQGYLARALNVSLGQVRKLESGEREPKGAILKLLNLVKQNGIGYIQPL